MNEKWFEVVRDLISVEGQGRDHEIRSLPMSKDEILSVLAEYFYQKYEEKSYDFEASYAIADNLKEGLKGEKVSLIDELTEELERRTFYYSRKKFHQGFLIGLQAMILMNGITSIKDEIKNGCTLG